MLGIITDKLVDIFLHTSYHELVSRNAACMHLASTLIMQRTIVRRFIMPIHKRDAMVGEFVED